MTTGPSDLSDGDHLELMLFHEKNPLVEIGDLMKLALSIRRSGWDDGAEARGLCWEDFA
jgi:hypothetical protein